MMNCILANGRGQSGVTYRGMLGYMGHWTPMFQLWENVGAIFDGAGERRKQLIDGFDLAGYVQEDPSVRVITHLGQ